MDPKLVDSLMQPIMDKLRKLADDDYLANRMGPGDPAAVNAVYYPGDVIIRREASFVDPSGRPGTLLVQLVAVPGGIGPDGEDFSKSGNFRRWRSKKRGLGGTVSLFVNTDHAQLNASYACFADLRSTLVHELVHAYDPTRKTGEKDVDKPEDSYWSAYYNRPREVRARMREIYDNIRDRVARILSEADPEHLPRLDDVLQQAMMRSHTWQKIRHDITPQNLALLLKGLVTALEDEGIITVR